MFFRRSNRLRRAKQYNVVEYYAGQNKIYMRAVIQRVSRASVSTERVVLSEIGPGLVVLVGIEEADTSEDIEWLSNKIIQLRIFNDSSGVMNLSVLETGGEIIVVSQFTLHAKTKKGNRPSYIMAAAPQTAIPLYERFVARLSELLGKKVGTGRFGAMMNVEIINDGPVTILIDTKNKE
jgi:D-aminoacyl-tRNA deacylase